MKLTQSGPQVEGTYAGGRGQIAGTVSGSVFTGRWRGASARTGKTAAGLVVLTLRAGGRSFSGRSDTDAAPTSWSAEWSGACVSGRCLQSVPRGGCVKTYVIQPSGETIAAHVPGVELPPKQLLAVQENEKTKYAGWPYTPTGAPESNKQNCAGLVMAVLFPGVVTPGNFDTDLFFQRIVKPYGKQVSGPLQKDDVVLYFKDNGAVGHVAIVDSVPPKGTHSIVTATILTKDGNERPYYGKLYHFLNPQDPLVQAHAPGGHVEVWRLDRSKVHLQEISSGDCDCVTHGARLTQGLTNCTAPKPQPSSSETTTGQAGSFTLVPALTQVSSTYGNLTINASGGKAHLDQGIVVSDLTWTVPTTLTPGKTASVTLGINATNSGPKPDPGQFMIGLRVVAPGLTKQLNLDIATSLSGQQTYDWTVPDSTSGNDLTVVIYPYESASVTYHYRRSG